jgi:hypothetical protein
MALFSPPLLMVCRPLHSLPDEICRLLQPLPDDMLPSPPPSPLSPSLAHRSSGVCQWGFGIINSNNGWGAGNYITLDAAGDVYINGAFSLTFTYNGIAQTGVTANAGGSGLDFFFAKINPSTGALLWVTAFGGTAQEGGGPMAVDGSTGDTYGCAYVPPSGTCIVAGTTFTVSGAGIAQTVLFKVSRWGGGRRWLL